MTTATTEKAPLMGNKIYDVLKYITEIGLPALGTLYFTLSQIWGFPAGEKVVGTVAALTVALGVLIGLSRKRYNASDQKYDGAVAIEETADGKLFSLELDGDPEQLDKKSEILFKVKPDKTI